MALVVADRVQETTSTTGTSSYALLGAATGYQSFGAVLADGDTTYYAITNDTDWEVGIGTYSTTGPTLARTTILASSNGGSAVNWGVGVKNIFVSYAASKAVYQDESGNVLVADKIVHTGDADTAIRFPAANTMSVETGGTERFKVENSTITTTVPVLLPADPTLPLQAATKEYVDTIASAGIHYHAPVRVESPINLNATYNNGTSGVGATLTNAGTQAALVIDGVTVATNDRVLVYEQTNQTQNGVYTVTNTGSVSTNWVLTRSTDTDSYGPSDPDALGAGDAFFVQQGNTGAGELYVCNTEGTITFGTTNITFTQIAATAVYTAGTAISVTNNVITNTAPDQVVSLTQGGATTITGTYPSFTISSTDTTYTAGGGIGLTGTTFSVAAGSGLTQDADGLSHADTSSQASVDNSGATFVQDINLDGFGHVTGAASVTVTPSLIGAPQNDGTGATGTWGISISGNANNVSGTVSVSNGGTGATTAGQAVINLGAAPLASPAFTGDVSIEDKIVHTGDANTAIRFPAPDTVTVETNGVERFRVADAGAVGIGVTPSAWASPAAIALEFPNGANLFSSTASVFQMGANNFFDGAYKYKTNGFASRYRQDSGTHFWDTVASGTAGNAITFVRAMTLDASGNLSVTGTASATTASVGTNTTQLATTAFVNAEIANDAALKANNLSDLASASTARTNLGLAIGSNVQAYDAGLQSISGLTTSANQMIYTTASDTYATTSLTAAGRAILDDADAAAQRTTLGLGTIATQAANSVSITGGSISGITDLAIADGGTGASDAGTARTNLNVPTRTGGDASGTWGINITGDAGSVDGLSPPQFYNNMGQNHNTQTDFNAVSDFGARYLQGGTNGPTVDTSDQFYGFTMGLGNDYPLSQYGSQFYWPRAAQDANTYIYVRDREGGSWGSWRKTQAGYADSAGSATNLSTNNTNWSTNGTISAVVGQLAWKNYGNSHTIFDASASTAPNGSSVNNTNAQNVWVGSYPTLMGWNGANTFGVRVDSARVADNGGAVATINVQEFTSGGTWTKPAGAMYSEIIVLGAGQGGRGGQPAAMCTPFISGIAGNSGGYGQAYLIASGLTATVTVTIGAGGTANTGTSGVGGTGGTSSFGAYVSATGGGSTGPGIGSGTNVFANSGRFADDAVVGAPSQFGYGGSTTARLPQRGGGGGGSTTSSAGAGGAGYVRVVTYCK